MRLNRIIALWGFWLILALLIAGIAHAEDICFSEDTARRITVDLEKAKSLKEQVELYEKGNAELEKQITLLKEINKLKDEQIAINNMTIKQYQELLKFQKDTYEQIVKDAKPSVLKQIIDALGFIGIGILAGILIL